MNEQEFETEVWRFYLNLEKEFINTLNYVEMKEDNFKTYSIEYEKLLLSIGSEVDILFKLLCNEINNKKAANIREYAQVLCGYEKLTTTKLFCNLNGNEYTPFEGWTEQNSLSWWKAYNEIKHNRLENNNYKKGNLKNVFYAMMCLYLLNRYCFRKIKSSELEIGPNPRSDYFSVVGWDICINEGNDFYRVIKTNGHISFLPR